MRHCHWPMQCKVIMYHTTPVCTHVTFIFSQLYAPLKALLRLSVLATIGSRNTTLSHVTVLRLSDWLTGPGTVTWK